MIAIACALVVYFGLIGIPSKFAIPVFVATYIYGLFLVWQPIFGRVEDSWRTEYENNLGSFFFRAFAVLIMMTVFIPLLFVFFGEHF